MSQTPAIRTAYAQRFHCIGSKCEDTCCRGWNVPVDQASYTTYHGLAPSPLRSLIVSTVQVSIEEAATKANFAKIQINRDSQCPLLSDAGLCRIQSELGERFLSHTCATYPRLVQCLGGVRETALALSCPEAARLVLLAPDLLTRKPITTAEAGDEMLEAAASDERSLLLPWSRSIRQVVLAVVVNRAYPLWQRLFMLGVFCRRLDAIANGELERSVPAFLADFEATVVSGALKTAMETLPLDREAQLDVVLRLAGMMLRRSNISPRFLECVNAFTAGIGNGPEATIKTLAIHYAQAHDRYYAPFFDRHPHVLENMLVNTILRCRFPFGREDTQTESAPSMARDYALLTAQFALVKGLLIGVAGFHREAFSSAHVVHTVQAASKHFEHHPEFLKLAYELLVESRMDGARGLAILLRNTELKAPSEKARPQPPAVHAPSPILYPQPSAKL